MSRRPRPGLTARLRFADALRLVASAALLVLMLAFFGQPLRAVLGTRVLPAGGLGLFGPSSASGFVLQVTTEPSGATISIDGEPRGTTPAILNVVCKEGQEIALALQKDGFPEFHQVVVCREGQRAHAQIRLSE